jgi:hypothetical protein
VGGIDAYSRSQSGTSGNITLTNNTVTANTAGSTGGCGGVQAAMNVNTVDIFNNILWGNTASSAFDLCLSGTGTANGYNNDYSAMSGSWTISDGNIDANPLFVDSAAGDFHLQSASPCIDAGTPTAPHLPATDFEGDPRMKVDIGADEYPKAVSPWLPLLLLEDP